MPLIRPASLVPLALLSTLVLPQTRCSAAPAQTPRMTRPPGERQSSMPQYAAQYITFFKQAADGTEKNLPELTRVAEIVAKRYIAGGEIVWPWNSQSLQQEMTGRAGGMIHFGPNRGWNKARTAEEKSHDVVFTSWDRAPGAAELEQLKKLKESGAYFIGFGPRGLPALAHYTPLFDAWFDTGLGADDQVVMLPGGAKAGQGNVLVNMLNGWTFEAELISAFTRAGKMPPMYQSYMVPGAKEWSAKYAAMQFHDDLTVAPIPAGVLGKAFLNQMRDNVRRFDQRQSLNIIKAAALIAEESKAGRKTVISMMGHAPWTYIGRNEEASWSIPAQLETFSPAEIEKYSKVAPDGALVLRIGYTGYKPEESSAYNAKKQRVILVSSQNPEPDAKIPADLPLFIDMEWTYGDASTPIEGYPVKVFPPSGIMQLIAFESINVEVLAQAAEK